VKCGDVHLAFEGMWTRAGWTGTRDGMLHCRWPGVRNAGKLIDGAGTLVPVVTALTTLLAIPIDAVSIPGFASLWHWRLRLI
jgi:hypothetical protein